MRKKKHLNVYMKLRSSSILCVLSGIRVAKSLRQNRDTISIVSPLCVHEIGSNNDGDNWDSPTKYPTMNAGMKLNLYF